MSNIYAQILTEKLNVIVGKDEHEANNWRDQ